MKMLKVKLYIQNIRIGCREGTERSDLPVFLVKLGNGESLGFTASAFKGLLRRAAEKVLILGKFSKDLSEKLIDAYKSLFGESTYFNLKYDDKYEDIILTASENKSPTQSKLRFLVEPIPGNTNIQRRASIRVNDRFLSVERGALWDYEFLSVDTIDVNIISTKDTNKYEKMLLYLALTNLKYESIGGFGSRGIGIVEEVKILDEEFLREAKSIVNEVCK